ncbi:MAG: hypothetical protein HUJ72_09890 [Blautia sp.]|nr:hypothetical protein [Blautia sp.]
MEYDRGLAVEVFPDESFVVEYKGKQYHFSGSGMEASISESTLSEHNRYHSKQNT